jgi:raffinose/stachyose/melibiose transport system permease protein
MIVYSWSVWDYDGFTKYNFVGFDNFIRLFTRDDKYWSSVLNTFILALGKLIIELPLALFLAYILDQKLKFRVLFRTIYFLPTTISVAITGIIFFFMFAAYGGIVNGILMELNILSSPVNWFETKLASLFIVGIASLWQSFGIVMILFLMGLQSVPKEIYDSASIDGANERQKFFRITIPMLGPVLQMIVMLALIGSLKITDLVLVLTDGRPSGEGEVMMTYLFKFFFGSTTSGTASEFGYGAALTIITSFILGIVTYFYLRFSKKSTDIY